MRSCAKEWVEIWAQIMYRESYFLILILAYECRGPVVNRRWFRGQDFMPSVAIIWHVEVDFTTYKLVAAIQSGWHDSARSDAAIASRLALVIDLDLGIQFVKVQAIFNSLWFIS